MELSKVYAEQKEHMEKCIAALKRDFMTIRSGKVSISILDNIHVTIENFMDKARNFQHHEHVALIVASPVVQACMCA